MNKENKPLSDEEIMKSQFEIDSKRRNITFKEEDWIDFVKSEEGKAMLKCLCLARQSGKQEAEDTQIMLIDVRILDSIFAKCDQATTQGCRFYLLGFEHGSHHVEIPKSLNDCRLNQAEVTSLFAASDRYQAADKIQSKLIEKFTALMDEAGKGLLTIDDACDLIQGSESYFDGIKEFHSLASAALLAKDNELQEHIELNFELIGTQKTFAAWLDKIIEPEQHDHFKKLFETFLSQQKQKGEGA